MTGPLSAAPPDETLEKPLLYALGMFAFTALFSVTGVEIALFLGLALLLAAARRAGALRALPAAVAAHPLFIPWLVYLAAGLISAFGAAYPGKALAQVNSDLLKFVCFSFLYLAVGRRHLGALPRVYLAAAALAGLIGIGEVAGFFPADNVDATRADAFMNAVRYGEVIGLAFLLSLSGLLLPPQGEGRRTTALRAAAAAVLLVALVLSKTRGAYFGVFAGVLVLLAFSGLSRKKFLLLFFAMLLSVSAVVRLVPSVAERFGGLKILISGVLSKEPSKYSRVRMWRVGAKMLEAHPVLGVGPGNVKKVFAQYCPELIEGQTWGTLHNLYVQQAAERGLVGLGALLFLLGSMFRYALANFRASRSALTLWALCALPAFWVMNLTEISFQHVHTSFAVFLALAFSAAAASPGGQD